MWRHILSTAEPQTSNYITYPTGTLHLYLRYFDGVIKYVVNKRGINLFRYAGIEDARLNVAFLRRSVISLPLSPATTVVVCAVARTVAFYTYFLYFSCRDRPFTCLCRHGWEAKALLQPIRNPGPDGGGWSASSSGPVTREKTPVHTDWAMLIRQMSKQKLATYSCQNHGPV